MHQPQKTRPTERSTSDICQAPDHCAHFMKTLVITLCVTLLLTVTSVFGQTYEPMELAKRIFSKDSFPDLANYITGEYDGIPNGQDLQSRSTTKFLLLGQTENKAVVCMTILDSVGNGLDTYLHFKKDSVWKMCAFRALALTGMIEQVKTELEKLTPQQVDDMIAQSKRNKKGKYVMFNSREDYHFQLGNARLTLALDDTIVQHFITYQAEFERLKNLALTQLEKEHVDDENMVRLIENAAADYQKIFIASVSTGGYPLGNCINFYIGGLIDNAVGYIYVKDKKDVPEMSPGRVIMIREIGNGWYMYKTT